MSKAMKWLDQKNRIVNDKVMIDSMPLSFNYLTKSMILQMQPVRLGFSQV